MQCLEHQDAIVAGVELTQEIESEYIWLVKIA